MRKPSKQKLESFQEYLKVLQTCFPEAQIESMPELYAGADFWIRVKAPVTKVEDILAKTAELSYDWYIKYKVNVLASVSGTGPITTKT